MRSLVLTTLLAASLIAVEPPADPRTVDVSNGIGIPFGGVGTGYTVFGRCGFVRFNVDGIPDPGKYRWREPGSREYIDTATRPAPYAFVLEEGGTTRVLQQTVPAWLPTAQPVTGVTAIAHLPKGYFTFAGTGGLAVRMTGFAPMVPHDLAESSIPAQVFDLTVTNPGSAARHAVLRLAHAQPLTVQGDVALHRDDHGGMAFAAEGGAVDDHGVAVTVDLAPGASRQVRFFIAWHYPSFTLPRGGGGPYLRRYTEDFADAAAVIRKARARADAWSAAIDRWHDAFQVPPEFHRLWFSSLSSVICSTMLGTHRQFFEIETPHDYVNTMDVCAYSNWLYLVNWPEIERMDMDMFFSAIPTDGPQKGFVWHSLWQDPADYVEEPTFLVRLWRDHRWFNDRAWLATGFPHAVNAANRVYATAGQEALIKSPHGNQSYDLWKMPGIGSYVNSAWIYGLWSLERMTEALGQPATVGGTPVADLRRQAVANFDRILWNETTGAWDCFAKAYAPDATSVHDSLFTDQLFGRWMCLLDPRVDEVLPPAKVQRSLATLYRHNLLVDEAAGFRGWTNGRLPSGKADTSGTHAQTAWICAQTDLGSLLGASGDEAASLDVFRSVEGSLKQNHLAVGEWNRAITADGRADIASEPGKDTPRFAPYPRYKCTWEYQVRMLGLTMDDQAFTVAPFHTIPIGLTDVRLAGTSWTIRVAPGWTRALVDGQPVALPVTIPRTRDQVRVEFLP